MPSRRVNAASAAIVACVAAFTAVLAALVPSVVLAARDGNLFVLSLCVGCAAILVLLDGIAIGLLLRARRRA